jgi:WD40 repeat protein
MLAPDSILHDHYRITYVVDERPDSVIYRAIDQRESLRVLVAELPQPNESALRDVQLLAEQIALVRSPSLLTLRDHFAMGLTYVLICDDPGGQDLERLARDRGGPLPENEVLNYVERLLIAIDAVHSHTPPLYLCDLRSTDLWSSLDGGLFMTPFTLARHIGAEPSPYRAPELHDTTSEPTAASDLYALGAVLYQLLTGWAPPTAAQREAGMPINSPRILNARVSPLAEQLVLRALELKPANRYQRAREMRSAVETVRLMAGRPLGATPPIAPSLPASAQPGMLPPPAPAVSGPRQATPPAGAPVQPPAYQPQAQPGYAPQPQSGYAAQPQTQPSYAAQPQAGYTQQPQAPRPAPVSRISNGCLLALVGVLAVLALMICIVGLWVGWLVMNNGMAALPVIGGATTNSTVVPAVPSAPSASAPTASAPPAAAAPFAASTTLTVTKEIADDAVGSVLYAPDGARLAVALGSTVQLRDGASLDPGPILVGHTGDVGALAFSPDGALLATGAQDDPQIRIWDAATGREVQTLSGHTDWIRSLAFSPDGALLASGAADRTLRLWDTRTWRELAVLEGHTDLIGNIAFSPDGTTLASASRDGTVRLWDVARRAQRDGFQFTAPVDPQTQAPYWLTGLAFSPDGRRIAVGSVSNNLYLLDARNGDLQREFRGHEGWVVLRGVAFSPAGDTIATAGLDGTVRIWSVVTGVQRAVLRQQGLRLIAVAWHPDGDRLVSSSDTGGSVTVWSPADEQVVQSVQLAQGSVTSLAYSLNGTVLATGGINGTVRLHSLADDRSRTLSGGSSTNQYLGFLSETQFVAISDTGDTVLIDLAGQGEPRQLEGLDGFALNLTISRDRRLIAAGNERGEVAIWDAQTLELVRILRGLDGAVYGLDFSRDASRIAAVSNQPTNAPTITVWDATNGNRLTTIRGLREPITAIAMLPGEDAVVGAGADGVLHVWNTRDGAELRSFAAAETEGWFSSIAVSPDGSLIATGSAAGTVEIWETASGRRISSLELAGGTIFAMAFRPDGAQLAVSTSLAGVFLIEPVA